jgi:hypothetical protein
MSPPAAARGSKMADYTGFVEAGEAFVDLLREYLTPEPISKRELISLCSPHESENNQLTVFMYHVEEDPQNNQAGFSQYSTDIQRANPARYHLSLFITAHSKAPTHMKEADQYRMIGAVIQIVKDNPVLEKRYLSGSILDSNEELHLSVERMSFDQLIKIWNNNASPYKLSIVVKIESVPIDSKRMRRVARVTDVEINTKEKI